jgi:hypothetical protein
LEKSRFFSPLLEVVTKVIELIRSGRAGEARQMQLRESTPLADRLERLSLPEAYVGAFFNPKGKLRRSERAAVMCLAVDREQAKIVHRYIKSFYTDIKYLARVERETAAGLELSNGIDVGVHTNDFRAVRGRAVGACDHG